MLLMDRSPAHYRQPAFNQESWIRLGKEERALGGGGAQGPSGVKRHVPGSRLGRLTWVVACPRAVSILPPENSEKGVVRSAQRGVGGARSFPDKETWTLIVQGHMCVYSCVCIHVCMCLCACTRVYFCLWGKNAAARGQHWVSPSNILHRIF